MYVFFTICFLFLFNQTVFSQSLVGSRESLQKQNEVAKILNLPRIHNEDDLEELKRNGILVPIPESVLIDERIPKDFRFVRYTTAKYIDDLAIRFINAFGRMFQINSAVRTTVYQAELQKVNSNAAPISGDRASTHNTGSTIDIGKIGLSLSELDWLRQELLFFEEQNLIEATEEWSQLVFHIMIFDWYHFSILE